MEPRKELDLEIETVCSWILRVGVVASVAVMFCGLALSFWGHPPSVAQMESRRFNPDLGGIILGSVRGDGPAMLELGVLMLVLTPILRVAGSMVLFATEERDWLYAIVTALVLAITLISLLVLK